MPFWKGRWGWEVLGRPSLRCRSLLPAHCRCTRIKKLPPTPVCTSGQDRWVLNDHTSICDPLFRSGPGKLIHVSLSPITALACSITGKRNPTTLKESFIPLKVSTAISLVAMATETPSQEPSLPLVPFCCPSAPLVFTLFLPIRAGFGLFCATQLTLILPQSLGKVGFDLFSSLPTPRPALRRW